ncbi:hypothetical protein Ahy_B08g089429 [Arachis hypogaea]|uniref:Aminotransferase-like plant mobile domain-containing protein n=1 Tax=Arachis hypogaea TaxID=3818 RepID=A0A444XXV8_ARAHY|nr:hypothetical protein Ahy_B08g089429 [Arachis hypogaea]
MCRVANRNVTNLARPLQLLQSWIFWRFPTLRPQGFDAFSFPLASRYSLIHMGTYLPTSDGKEQRIIQYHLALDRLGDRDVILPPLICIYWYNADLSPDYQIVWEPYGSLDVLAVIHPEILTKEHSRLWWAVTSLIYFAVIEWHQVDRVFPQLGGVQHLPEPALNIEYLHSKDGRGGDRWFSTYYRTWHEHWDEILSLRIAFADPRPVEVPEDAILRGSSQAPVRVPASDMPDNRRVERR